jgi:hypothetical protein
LVGALSEPKELARVFYRQPEDDLLFDRLNRPKLRLDFQEAS